MNKCRRFQLFTFSLAILVLIALRAAREGVAPVPARSARRVPITQAGAPPQHRSRGFRALERSHKRVPGVQAAIPLYGIEDLATLGGKSSHAYGLNASGQVVGYSYTARGERHAFLYRRRVMTDLGTLGGKSSWAYAVTDAGQVVGWATDRRGRQRAFFYDGGALRAVRGLNIARTINSARSVAGSAWEAGRGGRRAVLYDCADGALRDLGALGGSDAEVYGCNSVGQVVGSASTRCDWFSHAFLWSEGRMEDLGTLGGQSSQANGINGSGQIVGSADTSEGWHHAFLRSDGVLRDLGTLGGQVSEACGINDLARVVGWACLADGQRHAFLYTGGVMVDLNGLLPARSGWTLTIAQAINDAGQIVGFGFHHGLGRAFLLTPHQDLRARRRLELPHDPERFAVNPSRTVARRR